MKLAIAITALVKTVQWLSASVISIQALFVCLEETIRYTFETMQVIVSVASFSSCGIPNCLEIILRKMKRRVCR